MARKRKLKVFPGQDQEYKNKKRYPYFSVWARSKALSESDVAFILLLYAGMPATRAYRVIYPTKASSASISAMVSRLKTERWVSEAFENILRFKPWWKSGYDHKEHIYD